MMKKRLLWEIVSVCLMLLLCWQPTKYVDCTKQPQEAQDLLVSTDDISPEEEPGDTSYCKTFNLEDSAAITESVRINEPGTGPDTAEPETGPDTAVPETGPGTAVPETGPGTAELKTVSGPAEPKTVSGPAEPETVSGPAEPETVSGPAEPETVSGPAEPETVSGPAEPETVSGPAEPETVSGPAEPETVSGPAEPETVSGPAEPETVSGPAEPETVSGPAEPETVSGPAEPETVSGTAEPETGSATAEPETGSGTAEPETVPGTAEPETVPGTAEPETVPGTAEPETVPGTAEPETVPGTAEPETGSGTAEPETWPETAEPENRPDPAKQETGPDTTEPETGTDTAELESGTETVEPETWPETAEPENRPDPAEQETVPDTAEPETVPDTAEPETVPDTAEPETVPDTAEPETVPDTAEPETGPDTAEPETGPDTAEPETGPDTVEPETGPDTVEPETGPDTAEPESGPVDEQQPLDVPQEVVDTGDLALADCEAAETNQFDSSLSSLPTVLENTSNVLGKGTSADLHLAANLNKSQMLEEQGLSSHDDTDPTMATKDAEDIPTFDEWKKKMMEVEKEKTQVSHTSTASGPNTAKKLQKNFNNYASVECGAKILGSNPEAKSTSAILMESMDHYMLNPCSNKIWFIIELCDPIQVKQLDIANFELFSSTPKDFLVSISDRYPTSKWVRLGTFHARDERTVQTFPLDEQLYAKYVKMFTKYIKVELVSHHGSEHFCPLSLMRVFGTSMVEEYEEIADPLDRPDDQDDDLDYPPGRVSTGEKASNDSLADTILNMVNIIKVNVLGGGPGNGSFSGQAVNVTTMAPPSSDTASTLSPVPDAVEEELPQVPEDPDITTTEDHKPEPTTSDTAFTEGPKLEPSTPDTPASDETEQKNIAKEDIVKHKEVIQSIVTVLEEEEEEAEEDERRERYSDLLQQESLDYCDLSSSTCSSSASFQEYLLQHCCVQRKCISQEKQREAHPTPTQSQQLPITPTATQQPHSQREESQAMKPSSAPNGRGGRHTDHPPDLPWVEIVGDAALRTDQPLLEPSQTSSLPTVSSTITPSSSVTPSSSTSFSPTVHPPYPTSSQGLPGLVPPVAENSQEEQNEEHRCPAVASTSTISDHVERTWGAPSVGCLGDDIQVNTPPVGQPPPTVSISTEQQPPPSDSPSTPVDYSSVSVVTTKTHQQAASVEFSLEAGLVEDVLFTSSPSVNEPQSTLPVSGQPSSSSSPQPSASPTEFYAEHPNRTEQETPMHGSTSQKESVFMRLNNRIKALEMNMSLSGRYLEQLSQRYRRQMEEMQRAFNKTIIKLQHTSRMAEEQDLRQTESIQFLQGQLEDITELVVNLSVRVSQLQDQVSDRQNYLLLCLLLCVLLGTMLWILHSRRPAIAPPPTRPPLPRSYSYCCPERHFSEYEDMSLKRPASYPLLHSDSLQLTATTEGPGLLHTVEAQNVPPVHKKKKRCKMKVEQTVRCPGLCAPLLANGTPVCNGGTPTDPTPPTRHLRDPSSEGSSDGSSQPSFCGLAAASCTRLCEAPPIPGKRLVKRRGTKPDIVVVDLLQAAQRGGSTPTPSNPTLQHLLREKELSAGTLRVTAL
ncbi:hypothetical protein DPEC_G00066820 [Dallia pectoralis]|uniref:Uncharacterized protein n=1 Tax=Dallia pectoralis TaxID=75939 RepID=A0ACC2H8H9_DALPE|nr:hypothetical protein DPEC_G00066820 [Dallia pectoralis]